MASGRITLLPFIIAPLALGLGVAACLFPDFSAFDEAPATAVRDGGSSSGTSGGKASTSGNNNSSGTSGTPSGGGDSGGTSGAIVPPKGKFIACRAGDGGLCPIESQYCCTTVDGPDCRDKAGISEPSTCPIQDLGDGKALFCDGHEDCAVGEVCCFSATADDNNVHAKCTQECNSTVMCNGPEPECPSGKSCTGTLKGTIKVCQ